jgi:activator of 2-hydroxyglutaryl-CoA dehydratase/predicted nucleotide-binding protein (sugar kinase/HSP70/actin superfamily)
VNRPAIGLDVGSVTVKAVVADESGHIIWRRYARHRSRQDDEVQEALRRVRHDLGLDRRKADIFVTGSGAAPLVECLDARFVHEVNAVALAVEAAWPEARSVVELGGQDAKILLFQADPASGKRRRFTSMNDKCAGGTGSVIDRVAAKIGLSPAALRAMSLAGVPTHPVAGKCGVFAETDINSLKHMGVPAEQLVASLYEAVVVQNLTVLTRGNTLLPVVLLLGGPHAYLPGLAAAWRKQILRLWEERGLALPPGRTPEDLVVVPPGAEYFGALGAVEFGRRGSADRGRSVRPMRRGKARVPSTAWSSTGLCRSGEDLAGFLERYGAKAEAEARGRPAPAGQVDAFLGLDGGSTSVKAVLTDADGAVLASSYRLSRENPIEDAREVLLSLRDELGDAEVRVLGMGVTGYAKDVLKDVLGADTAIVETVAHARSALAAAPGTDVICDVGGQDIKILMLRDGRVKDFRLNTQCSAGNGYFLQNTAEGFGIEVGDYAEAAFSADRCPEFSYGCGVFLQSDIVDFQRQGWRPEEILAGLACVLPKNIWLYVARIPNLPSLGSRFLLQGGTQRNLAAVKAQVDFIEARFAGSGMTPVVSVHPHCGEAGAIGAAIEAREAWRPGWPSTFIGFGSVARLRYAARRDEDTRCPHCSNACARTFIDLDVRPTHGRVPVPGETDERVRVIAGHGCEKGLAEDLQGLRAIKVGLDQVICSNPNLAAVAAKSVWRSVRPGSGAAGRARLWLAGRRRPPSREQLRIGIPRALGHYQVNPMFSAYFESLGVKPRHLVYSDFTSERLYREGAQRGAVDPCFPSKVALAHVHDLLYRKHREAALDFVFFPMLDTVDCDLEGVQAACACPTLTLTPQTIRGAFTKESDVFADLGVGYVCPLLNLDEPALFERQLFDALAGPLALCGREHREAVAAGYRALAAWREALRRRGRAVLDRLEREGRMGILVLGRSYHADPGISHDVLDQLQARGYPILTQDTLPTDDDILERLFGADVRSGRIASPRDIGDVWAHAYSASSNRKIWAAKFAARHPNLAALELSSFKCGHDAPIRTVIEEIVEATGTPFFSFRDLDENNPAGSIKIRIETIDYFLKRYEAGKAARSAERLRAESGGVSPTLC